MSGHVEEAHEEVYNRLSDLRWSTLRHYASFFCGLPSMDRRNKHDLIYWIIRSSPPSVLDRLLTFAAEASQQADTHLGKRTRARDGTDEDEPAATRVRAAEAVDSSSFLEVPTDAERRHCYRSFYDATSNEALGSGVCWRLRQTRVFESGPLKMVFLTRDSQPSPLGPRDPTS